MAVQEWNKLSKLEKEHFLLQFMIRNTSLNQSEIQNIAKDVLVETYPKGTLLLRQGEISRRCYLVLVGCIRQYSCGEDGKETTFNFFTEDQSVVMFKSYTEQVPSDFNLSCVEDSILIVGDLDSEEKMYNQYPELVKITRSFLESNLGKAQEESAAFMSASPEQRYLKLLQQRPGLIKRVPQHQLASYLGMTPESLSRIKKRLSQVSDL